MKKMTQGTLEGKNDKLRLVSDPIEEWLERCDKVLDENHGKKMEYLSQLMEKSGGNTTGSGKRRSGERQAGEGKPMQAIEDGTLWN